MTHHSQSDVKFAVPNMKMSTKENVVYKS